MAPGLTKTPYSNFGDLQYGRLPFCDKSMKKLECHSTECQDLPSVSILQRVVELELYPIQMLKY